jgi:glycosyltransferase involved in cell wall biosynthesis
MARRGSITWAVPETAHRGEVRGWHRKCGPCTCPAMSPYHRGGMAVSEPSLAGLRVGVAALSLCNGGAERQAALWAAACANLGAEVRLFVLRDDQPRYSLPSGVPVEAAGKAGRADLPRLVARLRRFAADCDVLAAFQVYVGLLCALARPRPPWVLVTGQDPRRWRDSSRIPAGVYRLVFRSAAVASAPSQGLVDCHRAIGIRPRGRWLTIPNVVAPEAFRAPAVERLDALYVGRLSPEKDPLLAVRAAAEAELPLTLLGDGPLRGEVEREVGRLGLANRVTLRGFDPAPWEQYGRHRVLLVSSRYEAFGNVIVESLAAGTPVVSVDCDFGPREILAGARHSHLARPPGQTELAAGLRAVSARTPGEKERAECHALAERYSLTALAPRIVEALTIAR